MAHRIIDSVDTLVLRALLIVIVISGIGMSGCYYDNVEELYPDGCRTTDVSYSEGVVPILEANQCLSCHNSGNEQGGIPLEGYDNVLERVEDGSLMGAIRHEDEWEPMPLTGNKISNCSINRLQSWIDAGALNN